MKIATIILNYNDCEDTIELARLINSYSFIDKIVIVDNCSTDCSVKKIKSELIEKKDLNDKIHILELCENGGYGRGNNCGIKYAKELNCEYAIIANPDVRFENHVVHRMVDIMKEHEDCCVCGCRQVNPDNVNIIQGWKAPTSLVQWVVGWGHIFRFFSKRYDYEAGYFETGIKEVDCIQGAFLFVNVDKFLSCGGYDEEIFLYCEETSLGIATKRMGFSTFIDCDCSYLHMHSKSIGKSFPKWKSRYKLILKSRRVLALNNWRTNSIGRLLIDICLGVAYCEDFLCILIRKMIR